MGCTIVAVSDVSEAVQRPDGLDAERLQAHVAEHGSVVGLPGAWELPLLGLVLWDPPWGEP